MTSPTTDSAPGGEAPRGQVFDLGYQHYLGPREGRSRARRAIYSDGVKAALGIGRGGRAKIMPWSFIGLSALVAFIMSLVAGTIDRVAGPGASELANLPTHSDYYGFASILLFIFAATVGPEMLSPDRKNGVISLYLVRPLTTTDYVTSRWAAFFTVMVFVAWLPQTVLLAGLALGASEPAEYMKDNWLDVPRYLVSGAAIALYTTTLAMLVASYTTRRAMAAAFLIGLFVISAVFTSGLAESLDNTTGDWISMFNLANIPMHVNDWVFDATSGFLANEPSLNLPQWVRVVWFLPWTVIPFALMWRRYRDLTL